MASVKEFEEKETGKEEIEQPITLRKKEKIAGIDFELQNNTLYITGNGLKISGKKKRVEVWQDGKCIASFTFLNSGASSQNLVLRKERKDRRKIPQTLFFLFHTHFFSQKSSPLASL